MAGDLRRFHQTLQKNQISNFFINFSVCSKTIQLFSFQMAAHARDILNFKYCRDTSGGSREKAEEIIKAVSFVIIWFLKNKYSGDLNTDHLSIRNIWIPNFWSSDFKCSVIIILYKHVWNTIICTVISKDLKNLIPGNGHPRLQG